MKIMEPIITKEELTKLYWQRQLTQKEIANQLGVWDAEISNWMRYYKIPRRSIAERHALKVDFSDQRTLSYILGVLLGDGSILYNKKWRTHQIVMNTTSKLFGESFKEALKKIALSPFLWRVNRKQEKKQWSPVYRVGASSWKIVNWYQGLTLEEISIFVCKSKTLMCKFLKGFYESEGCYYKKNKTCSMSNSNEKNINLVAQLLGKLNIHYGIYSHKRSENRKTEFQIYMNTKESQKFLSAIKPCIKNP